MIKGPHARIKDISQDEYDSVDKILLDKNGDQKLVSAKQVSSIPNKTLALWCRKNHFYQIVTKELVEWVRSQIASDQTAIEICAGSGILGRELGIPQTDSCLHADPQIAERLKQLGQPIPNYPNRIEKLNAMQACGKYRPNVVVGCWVTTLGGRTIPQSSPLGVNEGKILKWGIKYIMIGNAGTHSEKCKLKSDKHTFNEYRFDWLYSRSLKPDENLIYVWE